MHGIIPIWKEKGMTSHDVVYKVRKIIGIKKVGHTGTLDPEVEGVLPICVGQATKLASFILDSDKVYEAEVTLGQATETEDRTGKVIEEDTTMKHIPHEELLQVFQNMTGKIVQTPPMYSAIRVNGRRLYEYARLGIEVERPSREVYIRELKRLDGENALEGVYPSFAFRVTCSKGTYVRTLAVDIGKALGYPAHMSALVRVESGGYHKEDCVTLQQLQEVVEQDALDDVLLPLETALTDYPFVEVPEEDEWLYRNGQVFDAHPLLKTHDEIVVAFNGKAIGIYQNHPTKEGRMKPSKMFPLNK